MRLLEIPSRLSIDDTATLLHRELRGQKGKFERKILHHLAERLTARVSRLAIVKQQHGLPELVAACRRAVILRAGCGGTRVSASPLVKKNRGIHL